MSPDSERHSFDEAAAHCPRCLTHYRAGFHTCADCGTTLVPGPAPATEEHAPDAARSHHAQTQEPPIVLGRLRKIDADLLVGRLRSDGIDAFADDRFGGLWFTDVVPEFALCRIWVPASQREEAERIARDALAGKDAI